MHEIDHSNRIRIFHKELLQWYKRNGRDLPWRRTREPYHILVSEIMLHQTQVERVIPKYIEWLNVYPNFKALASAPLLEVKQLWKPLGYNFRPERLHKIAQYVVNERNGILPNTLHELISLPGIGRYTAGAILSFAFHQDAAIVDTNIQRVVQRVFGVEGNPIHVQTKKQIWNFAKTLIPPGKGYVFNQALLDFGAILCTARNPHCLCCFVQRLCIWNNNQTHKE
jgi:A/G-specific adenine glycosylase